MPAKNDFKVKVEVEVEPDHAHEQTVEIVKLPAENASKNQSEQPPVKPVATVVEQTPEQTTPTSHAPNQHESTQDPSPTHTQSSHTPQPQKTIKKNQPVIKPVNLARSYNNNFNNDNSLSFSAILIAFLVSIIIGGLVIFGVYVYKDSLSNVNTHTPTPTPVTTTQPQTSPTPEPPAIEKSEIKIQVLNGTGVAGEAGVVQSLLNGAGFDDIATGNANQYGFSQTEISTYKNFPEVYVEELKELLGNYDTVFREDLDENYQYDVVIIVGTKN